MPPDPALVITPPPAAAAPSNRSRKLRIALASGLLLPVLLWCVLAIWLDGPASRPLAAVLIALVLGGTAAMVGLIRPFGRGLLAIAALLLIIIGWWLTIAPSNDRDWRPEVAHLPRARIEGSRLTIENLRNFDYATPEKFEEIWETRQYDLDTIRGFDIFLCSWGSPLIAHTIASWEFSDGSHLAVSIETRKEADESYSALRGFFRQFELYYVVADERDIVRLRTNYRGESVRLYRMRTTPENQKALLLEYMNQINRLVDRPQWYNAATRNCTTAIRQNNRHVARVQPWDWRILVNGRIDEWAYERGTIETGLPFDQLRELSDITAAARAADASPDFSRLIRQGLPAMQ